MAYRLEQIEQQADHFISRIADLCKRELMQSKDKLLEILFMIHQTNLRFAFSTTY